MFRLIGAIIRPLP